MKDPATQTSDPSNGHPLSYVSPRDVLDDPTMSVDEKRALLASWASDARAVENAPALRQLDDGTILLIDDVLDAMKQLEPARATTSAIRAPHRPRVQRRLRTRAAQVVDLGSHGRWWKRSDDDDDPPPCPVAARHPRPLPILDGAYAA